MKNNTISVIVSVYNMLPYLEKCVESILNQSYKEIELILVDDGSTDGSGELCDSLAESDLRVKVVHKPNGGNASARNAGIDRAEGTFISFIDADDWIEEDMYEKMIAEMRNSSISLVCCGIILTNIEGGDNICVSKSKKIFSREQALKDFWLRAGNVSPSACDKLYRKGLFDNGVRFNENIIHEDTEAMPRILNQAENIVVLNKALWHYVKRKNSASTSKNFNIKGYHLLDSMGEYEKMCKKEFPHLLPIFLDYKLVTTYEMYLNLMSCNDYKKYFVLQLSLRRQIFFSVLRCLICPQNRTENVGQLKVMLAKAILGLHLANVIFDLD